MAKTNVHPVRYNFYDYPHTREVSTGSDSYFKNCYPEKMIGSDEQNTKYYITKRPGYGTATYNKTDGEGRGMYIWNGNVYYVIGANLYKNNGSSLETLATTSGRVYWERSGGASSSEVLWLLSGQTIYTIEQDDTVTAHSGASSAATRLNTVAGGLANLDGYMFVCDTDGTIIHNTTQNDTGTNPAFGALNIISANVYADDLKGITRHLNYLVAFGEWSTEFFYNAGNTSGSILSRAEGTVLRYGTAAFATVWQDENIICWMARSRDGGHCVMVMEGLTPKVVSTQPIEKLLNSDDEIDDAYAYGIRIAGHIFYILTLPNIEKTLVFSLTDNTWSEWTSYDGSDETYFEVADIKGYISSANSTDFVALHHTDGTVHTMDITEYEDAGETIKVKIVTDKIDLMTLKRKFLTRLTLLGDLADSSVNISMRYTDDDYKTWSTSESRDMQYIPVWNALGSFNRRAFEFTFEADEPMRLEGMEMAIKLGTHAQGSL